MSANVTNGPAATETNSPPSLSPDAPRLSLLEKPIAEMDLEECRAFVKLNRDWRTSNAPSQATKPQRREPSKQTKVNRAMDDLLA